MITIKTVPFIELCGTGLKHTGFFRTGKGYISICQYLDKRNCCDDCKDRFVCFTEK